MHTHHDVRRFGVVTEGGTSRAAVARQPCAKASLPPPHCPTGEGRRRCVSGRSHCARVLPSSVAAIRAHTTHNSESARRRRCCDPRPQNPQLRIRASTPLLRSAPTHPPTPNPLVDAVAAIRAHKTHNSESGASTPLLRSAPTQPQLRSRARAADSVHPRTAYQPRDDVPHEQIDPLLVAVTGSGFE